MVSRRAVATGQKQGSHQCGMRVNGIGILLHTYENHYYLSREKPAGMFRIPHLQLHMPGETAGADCARHSDGLTHTVRFTTDSCSLNVHKAY
jgi:hypothetical protein